MATARGYACEGCRVLTFNVTCQDLTERLRVRGCFFHMPKLVHLNIIAFYQYRWYEIGLESRCRDGIANMFERWRAPGVKSTVNDSRVVLGNNSPLAPPFSPFNPERSVSEKNPRYF